MQAHKTASREEWLGARRDLLAKEKALLKQQDALAAERRAMPWVKVEKTYVFDAPDGKKSLADLFAGRSQLIVKHFMLGPDWDQGCIGCSFGADQLDSQLVHLINHDVMLVAVSRAPLAKIQAFQKRMGWHFEWVSSFGSDFNFDYHVSFTGEDEARGKVFYNFETTDYASDELPGFSVFANDEDGQVFHTYSVFSRGTDQLGSTYSFLDLTPKGRNEPTGGNLTAWVRYHDKYDEKPGGSSCHG